MPIDLDTLAKPASTRPPEAGRGLRISLDDLIAEPNFRPRAWQSTTAAPTGAAGWSKPPVGESEDLRRIIELPRRPQVEDESVKAEALVEMITERYSRPNAACVCQAEFGRECVTRLRLAQAWALYEIGLVAGLLGPIGVGHGKTMLDLLAPLAIPNCRLAVLLVPPGLVDQLITEYRLIGQHFRMPSLVVHGKSWADTVPGAPALHVFPYSRLSRPEATTWLENVRPDAIIADEVHKLRHADTATTSRVMRYFHAHPETRFCGWSGSITDSSVKDYAHLSGLALRWKSPLPIDPMVVDDWARALDPGDFPAPMGSLEALCEPGESVESGFHRRLVETIGVVSTTVPAIDSELEITERIPDTLTAHRLPSAVEDALNELRGAWMRPDGEELVEAFAVARCAHQLACGFYYRWIFPRGESVATILEWLEARKEWRRELRTRLRDRKEHLDSPKLAATAASRGWRDENANRAPGSLWYREDELPCWKAETWPRWKRARGTVEPKTEAVRLDAFLAEDAAEWGKTHRGVIWYQHRAFGDWVGELSGLRVHGGGPDAGPRIAAERGEASIIASIKSHGTGRDGLQRLYNEQLVANPPASATGWEQLLGRLHRVGQLEPVVRAEFYRHTPELQDHVDKALARALYVESTLGSAQKLRIGWNLDD